MISILGRSRVLSILIGLLGTAFCAATVYYYFGPQIEELEKETKITQGQVREKQAKIQELKDELANLEQRIVKFGVLKEKGFFNAQDRVTARETIGALSAQAQLLKTEILLSPGSIVDDPAAQDASYSLISGPMKVKVSALDDLNVYKFIVALQKVFPGYLEFQSLKLKRAKDLDKQMVRSILDGKPEVLIEGEAELIWWSMASQKQMEANPFFNPVAVPTLPQVQPSGGQGQ